MDVRNKIVEAGKKLKHRGVRYKLGAKAMPPEIPEFLDCSGFVRYCFREAGVKVPDGTYYQFLGSKKIDKSDLKEGDIGLMYSPSELKKGTVNHIGIYIGEGYWMHCNYSRNGITIERTEIFKHPRRFEQVESSTVETQEVKPKKEEGRKRKMLKVKVGDQIKELNGFEEKNTNFVSIRDIVELLGGKVRYDEKTQTVEIERGEA